MKALLIEVDYQSGERPGDIDPRDPNLQCYGWQSLPEQDGADVEVRLVEDERDLSKYEGVAGVRVLEGEEAINEVIEEYVPPKYTSNEEAVRSWLKRNNERVDKYEDKPPVERLKLLHKEGAPVHKEPPNKLSAREWGAEIGTRPDSPDEGAGRG